MNCPFKCNLTGPWGGLEASWDQSRRGVAGIAVGDSTALQNFQQGCGSTTLEGKESSVAASAYTCAIIVPDLVATGLGLFWRTSSTCFLQVRPSFSWPCKEAGRVSVRRYQTATSDHMDGHVREKCLPNHLSKLGLLVVIRQLSIVFLPGYMSTNIRSCKGKSSEQFSQLKVIDKRWLGSSI